MEDQIGRRFGRLTKGAGRQFAGGGRIPAQGGDIAAVKAFSRKQALFNEKAAQYANAGVISTPGYLRLESLVTGSTSQFLFNTLDTSGTKSITERRLKLNDTFTITDIAFYIQADSSAVANAPTDNERAKGKLYTYPNPNVTAMTNKADELESIYNGFLQLRIDSTTFIDSLPMRTFYRVGTSQQVAAATNQNGIARDEWPLGMYGRSEMLPSIELNGQANIEWSINLPNAQDCTANSTNYINLVLIFLGFLNQGAASVQSRLQKRLKS